MSLNNNYIRLDMVRVSQLQSGYVLAGKIKFSDLKQIYKLTVRKESTLDPIDGANYDQENVEFQRQLSDSRLKSIQKYLRDEMQFYGREKALGLFPSSVILYNRLHELSEDNTALSDEEIYNLYSKEMDTCFVTPSAHDRFNLYIPRNKGITLIVDGQHRFVGTLKFYDSLKDEVSREIVNNFEFIVTYLVGFDIYEVGQIFANVNFEQKPVNRSLYYDIFGSAPQTDRNGKLHNDIRLAHDLVLHLNNNPTSPIQGMIKLLGKGHGLFSQAFFVDKMIRYVFKSKIWDEWLVDYLSGGEKYRVIAAFIKSYFEALKIAYPSAWPQKINRSGELVYSSYAYNYVLCKTTGLGAYLRLIRDIYPLVKNTPENFTESILNIFNRMTDEEAKHLFSKNGDYGSSGSEGLQAEVYKKLLIKYRLNM